MNKLRDRSMHWLAWPLAGAILLAHFLLAVGSKFGQSTAVDEIIHLTSGVSYWKFGDYRLQPENGVLPQRWMAIPAVITGNSFPPTRDDRSWRNADAWALGHRFFYEMPGQDHFPMLMEARAMIALLSLGIGVLVFAWSRSLFGKAGAFISLIFFAACPNFLAHGALATSDTCLCLFMLASIGAWWRCLHEGSPRWVLASSVLFGLACVSKYSALLLLPMMLAAAVVRALAPAPLAMLGSVSSTAPRKLLAAAGALLLHGAAAVAVIWLFFGFRYSAFGPSASPADHFFLSFDGLVDAIGWKGAVVGRLAAWHALPEAYLYGFAYVDETTRVRAGFLNGAFSVTGWPSYFPWTFALKTPLPFIAALLLSLALGVRSVLRPGGPGGGALKPSSGPPEAGLRTENRLTSGASALGVRIYSATPLLVLVVVYGAFAISGHINIGVRHLLPIYPPLFILAGCLGTGLANHRLRAAAVGGLLAWHVAESVLAAPYYIAYFNELGGGPANGYRHLADSSVDWGQDLPGLKAWLLAGTRPGEPVYLAYFGTGEPLYYGIESRRLVYANGIRQSAPPYFKLGAGLYCVSATILDNAGTAIQGPWTLEREREFLMLRAGEDAGGSGVDQERFAELRLARLNAYLQMRRPVARIGNSIMVFRLTAEEVARATEGSTRDWAGLVMGAGAGG